MILAFVLAGCASDVNNRLPDSFVVDTSASNAGGDIRTIESWRKTVLDQLRCNESEGDPKPLCEVSQKVQALHPIRDLLRTASTGHTCAGDASPCLSAEYAPEWRVLYGSGGEATAPRQPELGIALSGGGQRSAFFSVGALKALYETHVLQKASYLSSVSGGGYAAYWYYNQLMDPANWTEQATPFSDCFNPETKEWLERTEIATTDSNYPICDFGQQRDPRYRFQYHLSKHTDILTATDGSFKDHLGEYTLDLYPAASAVAYTVPYSRAPLWGPGFFLSALPHHIANTLFDWSWNGSPYGPFYRKGIHRVYGPLQSSEPDLDCNVGFSSLGKAADAHKCLSYRWDADSTANGNLRAATERYWRDPAQQQARPYPIWIVNTQGIAANSLFRPCVGEFFLKNERALVKHNYELTPFGYGSGLFGYFWRSDSISLGHKGFGTLLLAPGQLEPNAAVHASGAAVDSAGFTSIAHQCPFRLFEQVANFSLGIKLTNPVYEESGRTLHRLLVWPLYYLHGDSTTPNSTEIYLSDGGHIDNLGLYALIRRGVKNIVVFDATQDKKGLFDDLVHTSELLKNENIGVRLEGLCDKDSDDSPCSSRSAYVFNICGKETCSDEARARASFQPRNAAQQVFTGEYFIMPTNGDQSRIPVGRIIYVKMSLPAGWDTQQQCSLTGAASFPCSAYRLLSASKREADFPNKSTLGITLDSKAEMFWALRDLGYHLGVKATQTLCLASADRGAANPLCPH
ncbi:MAG: hypothetical protein KF778_14980 [Rhodocyclaceae bacterium]|nr:hypothetical protein [Rhodocyclaceae bacterium]